MFGLGKIPPTKKEKDDGGFKEPRRKERPDEIAVGRGGKKVMLKTSNNLSLTEKARLVQKEKLQDQSKVNGVSMNKSFK